MDKVIEVKNLHFKYDEETLVLKDVSFSINKGEYVTLIGHNGSGKSTLAKLLCYIISPDKGEIYLNGILENEENVSEIRKSIGIVFQNPDNQFIGSTVADDIAFGLENRNVKHEEMDKIVQSFAKKVGMDKLLFKEPSELSGGQKQRVAIAGILALGLKTIIFDEATSMLDPEGVEEIKALILKMKEEDKDLTFISITHDIEESYLSDRVIILNEGQIYKNDSPDVVFDDVKSIESIGLDIPFVLKIKNSLKEKGINVPNGIKTIEALGEFLCK